MLGSFFLRTIKGVAAPPPLPCEDFFGSSFKEGSLSSLFFSDLSSSKPFFLSLFSGDFSSRQPLRLFFFSTGRLTRPPPFPFFFPVLAFVVRFFGPGVFFFILRSTAASQQRDAPFFFSSRPSLILPPLRGRFSGTRATFRGFFFRALKCRGPLLPLFEIGVGDRRTC